MNQGFCRRLAGGALSVLCLLLLSMTLPLAANEAPIERMIAVDNDAWSSDLIVSDAIGETRIEFSDYPVGPRPGAILPHNGAAIVPRFGDYGAPGPVRIVRLSILTGAAACHTQATYRDAAGDFNTVTIPSLGASLPIDENAYLKFRRIESTEDRSTWFALLTSAPALVTFYIYDGEDQRAGAETLELDVGFTFYELSTSIAIGRVELKCGGPFGGGCEAPVDAVAFVGYRSGGGPRVEMPTLEPTLDEVSQ